MKIAYPPAEDLWVDLCSFQIGSTRTQCKVHPNNYARIVDVCPKQRSTLRATHCPSSTGFLFPYGDQLALALAKLFPHSLCHLAVHEWKPWPRPAPPWKDRT